jgi:hypothetical protein
MYSRTLSLTSALDGGGAGLSTPPSEDLRPVKRPGIHFTFQQEQYKYKTVLHASLPY